AIYLADMKVRDGEPEAALEILDEAVRQAEEEASIFAPTADRVRAFALSETGRRPEAIEVAGAALEAARARSLDYEVAMLLLCKADLLEDQDPDEVVDLRREADVVIDRLDIRPLETA
ncbi:MAG: hypothetical protein KJP22_15315, partial [Acidimicrobiia bacterium]|nr:hypothetical protein [Acidimicrobiia bacterium]